MSDTAIRVEGLSKLYHIGGVQKQYKRLDEKVVDMLSSPFRRARRLLSGAAASAAEMAETIWALKDVSFEIKSGEVVGVIGRNGAGKSTLLKILSRITEPTEGYADIYGRVGSLLEVGTGFHPELTGRENIFLNGAILGMRKNEIERKFDEIVEFAEISKFIDTPVKHYSSGMYVRLAFSVAAHLEPEMLLVDEVLAVGDIAFQKKCLGKMGDVAQQGRTVLFVSHNMGLMQTLCQRGIFLAEGRIAADAQISDAVAAYLRTLDDAEAVNLVERSDRQGRGLVRLTNVEIINGDGEATNTLVSGRPARFVFHLSGVMKGLSCVFTIFNQLGQRLVLFKSDAPGAEDIFDPSLGSTFICDLDELWLLPGHYRINVLIRGGNEWQDFLEAAASFDVQPGQMRGRLLKPYKEVSISMPHRWTLPIEQ
jgi:lipopolysaccharide transport system ATP-binding protein